MKLSIIVAKKVLKNTRKNKNLEFVSFATTSQTEQALSDSGGGFPVKPAGTTALTPRTATGDLPTRGDSRNAYCIEGSMVCS
jgi:hypothetical protein